MDGMAPVITPSMMGAKNKFALAASAYLKFEIKLHLVRDRILINPRLNKFKFGLDIFECRR